MQEIYDKLVDLRTFVQINHSGFRKIVKKVRASKHWLFFLLLLDSLELF